MESSLFCNYLRAMFLFFPPTPLPRLLDNANTSKSLTLLGNQKRNVRTEMRCTVRTPKKQVSCLRSLLFYSLLSPSYSHSKHPPQATTLITTRNAISFLCPPVWGTIPHAELCLTYQKYNIRLRLYFNFNTVIGLLEGLPGEKRKNKNNYKKHDLLLCVTLITWWCGNCFTL